MSRHDEQQDHPLDESTSAKVQLFDADGYVLPDDDAALPVDSEAPATAQSGGAPHADTDEPAADDGLFNDQQMPTADGELSDPNPGAGLADGQTERTT